jgi:hypothetical protein
MLCNEVNVGPRVSKLLRSHCSFSHYLEDPYDPWGRICRKTGVPAVNLADSTSIEPVHETRLRGSSSWQVRIPLRRSQVRNVRLTGVRVPAKSPPTRQSGSNQSCLCKFDFSEAEATLPPLLPPNTGALLHRPDVEWISRARLQWCIIKVQY